MSQSNKAGVILFSGAATLALPIIALIVKGPQIAAMVFFSEIATAAFTTMAISYLAGEILKRDDSDDSDR